MTASLDDMELAMRMMIALAGDPDDIHCVMIPGEPASKARPRFAKGGRAYTSAESRAAELRTATVLRRSFTKPMTGNVALAAIFYRPNLRRIDTDNMLKHVCDSANGIVWRDDSQVTAMLGITELDPQRPRTLLAVSRHESTLLRGTDTMRQCVHCGQQFLPVKTIKQRICSRECNVQFLRQQRSANAKYPPACIDCGKTLSHKHGGRCRDCWSKAPDRRRPDGPYSKSPQTQPIPGD